jgi:two-component system CheB/CheR fusion protein
MSPKVKVDKPPAKSKKKKKPPAKKRAISDQDADLQKKIDDFPVVGIGASAGGMKALQGFFSQMPLDFGIAFVVVQHLDPKYESIMSSILSRHTRMKVDNVKDGIKVERDHVYFKPSDKDVVIQNRRLYLIPPEKKGGIRLPIDTFFRSLASDLKDKAIAIVLSGAGGDGTLGAKDIKGEGGMVMVQEESQAEYDGMPRSVIDSGLADFILSVEAMPEKLRKYMVHPFLKQREMKETEEEKTERQVQKVLMVVRKTTGHDFSHYKKNTILRRIGRRMAVHQIKEMADYYRFLRDNPKEVNELFKDMIISVTNFFRDPGAFEDLKEKAVIPLVRAKKNNHSIRIWVPGCGTGEEAYSIAILFAEAMDEMTMHLEVKVFASDIDPNAIDTARTAVYPNNIAADISDERLKRYFIKVNDSYKVEGRIRETVVFAVHDITKDPPFSRLDLVSCRNLLIYMDSYLQKKIIPLLHYSLNAGGFLFLGTSEGIGENKDYFSVVDKKSHIFKKQLVGYIETDKPFIVAAGGIDTDWKQSEKQEERILSEEKKQRTQAYIRSLVEKTILEKFAPPGVLVDGKLNILYFYGNTQMYLSPPEGDPSLNLSRMAPREIHQKLQRAIEIQNEKKRPLVLKDIRMRRNDHFFLLNVMLTPLVYKIEGRDLYLINFEKKELPARRLSGKLKTPKVKSGDSQINELESKLEATRQELQATIEELETSNEELKSANEELQANNEELQSTNEELESSKEELQSTNEELVQADDDIQNLFSSTSIGTLFLDTQLRIKRFTPPARLAFNLMERDIGRSIRDISTRIQHEDIYKEADQVLDSLQSRELEVKTEEGNWLLMRFMPYRTRENVIQGVVISFADISSVKEAEELTEEIKIFNESILDSVREPLVILDKELKVEIANRSFYKEFQVLPKETEGKNLYELGNGQWDIPELRKMFEEITPKAKNLENYVVEHTFPRIGLRKMLLNAKSIQRGKSSEEYVILLSIEDITSREKK